MKRISPALTTKEQEKINSLRLITSVDVRVGRYYSHLETHQRKRFKNIVSSITTKYGIKQRDHPVETLLIRQIALNTIRIEETELELRNIPDEKWHSDKEKWLFLAQKERREAIALLNTILQVNRRKHKIGAFEMLRGDLRAEEGLETSKTDYVLDGHDRRFYEPQSTEKDT